jgi:hypothetical protein
MRGFRFPVYPVLLVVGLLWLNTDALSYDHPDSNIRINFGGWDTPDSEFGIHVDHSYPGYNERLTDVWISGLSAGFSFSHMVGGRFAWELSMGGLSDSKIEALDVNYRDDYYDTIYLDTRSVSVSYLTAGLIYYPLSELDHVESNVLGGLNSFARPYLTAGIGPYFGLDVRSAEDYITEADFATATGGYTGAGMDLLLSRHFLFNVDVRYHFVEFGEPLKGITDYSGANVLAGFKIAF